MTDDGSDSDESLTSTDLEPAPAPVPAPAPAPVPAPAPAPVPAPAPAPVPAPVPEPARSETESADEIKYVSMKMSNRLPSLRLKEGSEFTPKLYDLYQLMSDDVTGGVLLKRALRVNLRFKAIKYRELREESRKELAREEIKVKKQVNRMLFLSQGHPGEESQYFKSANRKRRLRGGDRWEIFERFADRLMELRKEIMVYKTIEDRAIELLNKDIDNDNIAVSEDVQRRRRRLCRELENLTCFNNQPRILEVVAGVVISFLKNPYFVQDRFMNFVITGAAGTGKTSIVKRIAKVFACCGMYVYDEVLFGDRSSFVASYLGQTSPKTLDFCRTGLDKGAMFVDEAYSLTTWTDGQLDTYSQECVNAIVDFMTKYKGLYCFIAAGYSQQMERYFLPSNPGLERRVAYTLMLEEYDEKQMIYIFKYHMMELMGWQIEGCAKEAVAPVDQFFQWGAWFFLETFIKLAMKGETKVSEKKVFDLSVKKYFYKKKFFPTYPEMHNLVSAFAGSMTNLAEETVSFLFSDVPDEFGESIKGMQSLSLESIRMSRIGLAEDERWHTKDDMKKILKSRLANMSLSEASHNLQVFDVFSEQVEAQMSEIRLRSLSAKIQLKDNASEEILRYSQDNTARPAIVRPRAAVYQLYDENGDVLDMDARLDIIEDEQEEDLSVVPSSSGTTRQSTTNKVVPADFRPLISPFTLDLNSPDAALVEFKRLTAELKDSKGLRVRTVHQSNHTKDSDFLQARCSSALVRVLACFVYFCVFIVSGLLSTSANAWTTWNNSNLFSTITTATMALLRATLFNTGRLKAWIVWSAPSSTCSVRCTMRPTTLSSSREVA